MPEDLGQRGALLNAFKILQASLKEEMEPLNDTEDAVGLDDTLLGFARSPSSTILSRNRGYSTASIRAKANLSSLSLANRGRGSSNVSKGEGLGSAKNEPINNVPSSSNDFYFQPHPDSPNLPVKGVTEKKKKSKKKKSKPEVNLTHIFMASVCTGIGFVVAIAVLKRGLLA